MVICAQAGKAAAIPSCTRFSPFQCPLEGMTVSRGNESLHWLLTAPCLQPHQSACPLRLLRHLKVQGGVGACSFHRNRGQTAPPALRMLSVLHQHWGLEDTAVGLCLCVVGFQTSHFYLCASPCFQGERRVVLAGERCTGKPDGFSPVGSWRQGRIQAA